MESLLNILSSIVFLFPLLFVIVHMVLATWSKFVVHEIKHILWGTFFMLLFISNQLARIYTNQL